MSFSHDYTQISLRADYMPLNSRLKSRVCSGNLIMEKTQAFHNIIGVHNITRNGRPDKSYFPFMNFAGYDAKTNTISFFSPYLNYIVREIYSSSSSIKLDKKGNPRLKRNGRPMLNPFNSYLIKPSIIAERNKLYLLLSEITPVP